MTRLAWTTCSVLTIATAVVADGNGAIAIRMWPSAVVTGDQVLLAEICDYRGMPLDLEAAIAFAVIAPAPPEGGSLAISMTQVREALVESGLNFAGVTFEGASRCEVRRPVSTSIECVSTEQDVPISTDRPSNPALDPAPTPSIKVKTTNLVMAEPDRVPPSSESDSQTLRDVIHNWFVDRLGLDGGRLELQLGSSIMPYLDLNTEQVQFQIATESRDLLGVVNLDVSITEPGQAPRIVPTAVQCQLWMPQVVARRPINAKATIESGDLVAEERRITRLSDAQPVGVDAYVGQQARKYLPPGTVLLPNLVQPVPLVRRGELVDVISSAGGVVIQTTARAAEDGVLGSRIQLRTTDRRREEVIGVVVGANRVEIREVKINDAKALASVAP